MRVLVLVLVVVLGAAAAQASLAGNDRPVRCSEAVAETGFPYVGASRPEWRYRTLLDAVSIPPAFLPQIVRYDTGRFRYWQKAGLVVRLDGRPITVTVPFAWRTRVGFTWGNGGRSALSSLTIAGCGDTPGRGHAFAGGFFVRKASCVPLTFTRDGRSATAWFGVGRRCR